MKFALMIRTVATLLLLIFAVYPETGPWTTITLGAIAFALEMNSWIINKYIG